jgi:hypothetical protein
MTGVVPRARVVARVEEEAMGGRGKRSTRRDGDEVVVVVVVVVLVLVLAVKRKVTRRLEGDVRCCAFRGTSGILLPS